MKTVFLRIGSDKAGTVTITNLASKNRNAFNKFGVYAYPRNCFQLFELIQSQKKVDGVRGFRDRNEERQMVAEEFLEKHKRGEYRCMDALLVTETLWGRLSKRCVESEYEHIISFLRSIRQTFSNHSVKIILQLRRIDFYIESLYKQEVKAGRSVTLNDLTQWVTADRAFAFFRILEEVFGVENIIVRPFERSQLYNGCVAQDMLNVMGLSDHDNQFTISHGNEGLHRDLMETLVNMNQRYGKITSNNRLLQISSRLTTEFGYEDVKYLFGMEDRKKLIAQYEEFYTYLGQQYGDGESFFKEPLPDNSHLGYELDPTREALIEKMVLEQAEFH